MAKDDEKEFRLRPRKPPRPVTRNDARAWATAFKTVMHFARASRAAPKRVSAKRASIPRSQRCAVRVTYARNTVRGQWRAHGRYIERESAAGSDSHVGFDRATVGIDIPARLESWQAARDGRLWKMIVSPEFGDRVDLSRLTRDLMTQIERDIGISLEWVAISHFNTEHPHVHIAFRGVGLDRRPIHLKPHYIKHGIRRSPRIYAPDSSAIERNWTPLKRNGAKSINIDSHPWIESSPERRSPHLTHPCI